MRDSATQWERGTRTGAQRVERARGGGSRPVRRSERCAEGVPGCSGEAISALAHTAVDDQLLDADLAHDVALLLTGTLLSGLTTAMTTERRSCQWRERRTAVRERCTHGEGSGSRCCGIVDGRRAERGYEGGGGALDEEHMKTWSSCRRHPRLQCSAAFTADAGEGVQQCSAVVVCVEARC